MKLRNLNIALLLMFILLGSFLTAGCGQNQSPAKNPSVEEIKDKISESVDISEMLPGDEETLSMYYEINKDDIEEFVLYTAPSNLQAEELAIIKVKDSSKVGEIKNLMAQRVEEQASSFKDYLPEEYALIEKHVLKSNGNYLLLAISDKVDEIEKAFDSALK